MIDILNLKLKYAEKESKRCRRKYREKRKEVEALFPGKKGRKFRRIVARIGKNMKTEWRKGTRKMEDKLDWIQRKFKKAETRETDASQEEETFEGWTDTVTRRKKKKRKASTSPLLDKSVTHVKDN